MGNEQSGRQEPRRDNQQDAVLKALEAQRRIYEQRNIELNYRTAISESRAEEAVRNAACEAEAAARAQATARAEAIARAQAEARAKESARKAAIEAEAAAKAQATARAEAAARAQAEARAKEADRKAAIEAEAAAKAQAIAKAEAAARAEADAKAEAIARAEATARAREAARRAIAEAEAAAKAEEAAKAQAATIAQAAAKAQAAANVADDKKRAQQSSFEPDRSPAPYQYTGQDLQSIAKQSNQIFQTPVPSLASAPRQSLYPSLNNAPQSRNVHNFQFSENNTFRENTKNEGDFLFLNTNVKGQGPGFQPKPSAPPAPNRDRSASRNRNKTGKRNEENEINCPTCKNHFTLTIFQCAQGHSSCSTCKSMCKACGICGQSIGATRNFAVEAWVASKIVPCPNSDAGCQLSIMMNLMDVHIKECPFNEQECPMAAVYGYCPWRGKLNQIAAHFDFSHNNKKADVDTEIRLPNFNNNQDLYLVVLGVYNFLLHVKVSKVDSKLYMAAQLIGTAMSASKWYYEIHVYNKGEARRKYVYSDICTSSKESVKDLFTEGKCAVLPFTYAYSFLNQRDGVFTYKLFIKKTNEDRPRIFKNKATRGGRGGHRN